MLACAVLVSCGVQPTEGRSGLRVKVRWSDPVPEADVVHVRIVPELDEPRAWAIDASGEWPAQRVIWPREMGDVLVMAVAHECPSGCSSVDPWTDVPVARGQGVATLREGQTSTVTIDLVGARCGNSVLEPGESCDGGVGCDASCHMQPALLDERVGRAEDDVVALADDGVLVAAWLDGTCGSAQGACLSMARSDPSGSDLAVWRSVDVGETSGRLATDHAGAVGFHGLQTDGTRRLQVTLVQEGEATVDLGDVDAGVLSTPVLGGTRPWAGPFALAVSDETRVLQLRWHSSETGAGQVAAWAPGSEAVVRAPSVAAFEVAETLTIGALWASSQPGDVLERWMFKRWSCTRGSSGCVPVPMETEPVDISDPGFEPDQGTLVQQEGGELVLVAAVDSVLETRSVSADGELADTPLVRATDVLEPGAMLQQASFLPSGDVLALVTVQLTASRACRSTVVRMGFDGEPFSMVLGQWGSDGSLGCSASLVVLDEFTYAVVFRGQAEEEGQTALWWVRGATIPALAP